MHPTNTTQQKQTYPTPTITSSYARVVTVHRVQCDDWPDDDDALYVETWERGGFWRASCAYYDVHITPREWDTSDFPDQYFGPGDDPNGPGHARFVVAVATAVADELEWSEDVETTLEAIGAIPAA